VLTNVNKYEVVECLLYCNEDLHCCNCDGTWLTYVQGAGDAFIGSLAFYLATQPDLPLRDVIQRANEIATRSVLASGTQKSFPWRTQLPSELFSPDKYV